MKEDGIDPEMQEIRNKYRTEFYKEIFESVKARKNNLEKHLIIELFKNLKRKNIEKIHLIHSNNYSDSTSIENKTINLKYDIFKDTVLSEAFIKYVPEELYQKYLSANETLNYLTEQLSDNS